MARETGIKRSRADYSGNDHTPTNHLVPNRDVERAPESKNKKMINPTGPAPDVASSPFAATTNGSCDSKELKEEEKPKEGQEAKKEQTVEEGSPGFIFMCNGKTKPECYKYRVFGLPGGKISEVETIKPGAKLFLYDFDLKLLYGVYKATSRGQRGLEPAAFGGRFPAQVRFKIFTNCLPLPESAFRHAIKENYEGSRFKPQLSNHQVRKLIDLFRPIVVPATVNVVPQPQPSSVGDRYQQSARLLPLEDPYRHSHAPLPLESRHTLPIGQPHFTNPYFPAEAHNSYSRENMNATAHDPYNTRYGYAPDLVTGDVLVRESDYNRSLLFERERERQREMEKDRETEYHRSLLEEELARERERERERELNYHNNRVHGYYTNPSHAAAPTYAPSLQAPTFGISYEMPLSHAPAPPLLAPSPPLFAPSQPAPPLLAPAPPLLTPPPPVFDPAPPLLAPAPPMYSPRYWANVAREDPNQFYVDPLLHRSSSGTPNLAGPPFPDPAPGYR